MGPSAIRYAGLEERLTALGVDCVDRGNVATPVAEATAEHDPRARFLPAIRATCERIAELVGAALDDGRIPIVLGGDHSVALGTLGGLASRRGPGAVLWFDAHGDLNTPETSPSGNEWGMPLRMAIDEGSVRTDDVALVGARDLDQPEVEYIAVHGIDDDLDRALDGVDAVYVALDVDVFDPAEVSCFMPAADGLTVAEVEAALRSIASRVPVAGLGLTGLAPDADPATLAELAGAAGL